MTTIHMDVHAARRVQERLVRLRDEIQRVLNSTNGTVAGLPQNWRSHSADEFFGRYRDTTGEISAILGQLGEIADQIGAEIAAYERMAERLSS